jgi:hypothetical protein
VLLLLWAAQAEVHAQGQPSGNAPGQGAAQTTPGALVSLDAYVALLDGAAARLEADPSPNGLRAARSLLAEAVAVQLPAGDSVRLLPLLAATRDPQVARLRIETARAQLLASADDALADRQSLLAAILARPEFAAGDSLLDRVVRWLQDWFDTLLPDRTASPDQNAAMSRLRDGLLNGLLVAAGVALAVGLAWWVVRFVRGFVRERELLHRGTASDGPRTAAEARAMAQEQAQGGSYREAVRSLYLSALLGLEEARLVPADRTFTNHELLARIQDQPGLPPLRPVLAPVIDAFEPIWYGLQEPDAQTFARYQGTVNRLNEGVTLRVRAQQRTSAEASGPTAEAPSQEGAP